jgi:cellulose biosynthesis protein BcsQ
MSIVTFWNDDREQTGKTLTSVAVAVRMAMERNFKILLISTAYRNKTMSNCFFEDRNEKMKALFTGKNNNIAVENGLEGLAKLISSNKIQPNIITDYTRVIFKDRLEILAGYVGTADKSDAENLEDYKKTSESYVELIKLANQFYDMVLVDIDNQLEQSVKKDILNASNLNVLVISQRLESLKKYLALKEKNPEIIGPKCIPVLGKYNRQSKYNKKNVMRFLEEKKDLNLVPYSTLFYEAAEEANVTEMFLKLRNIRDANDVNYFFMEEVLKLTNNIITRLQELQKKMR